MVSNPKKSQSNSSIPLKPENSQFTDNQWQAIYDTGNNLLVSASAGSGKTTVLVKRVIEQILAGVNVDELLIVTFTEAAAREMKVRIEQALKSAISATTDITEKRHLLKQLTLLPTANISTLHAFCLQIIRRYYYLIDLDPVFRLMSDETEQLLLKEDVWENVREEYYGEKSADFYHLVENFSNDRNDDGFTSVVMQLYSFSRAKPDADSWLAELANIYQFEGNLTESNFYKTYVFEYIKQQFDFCHRNNQKISQLVDGIEELKKVAEFIQVEERNVQQLIDYLMTDKLTDIFSTMAHLTFEKYPSIRKLDPDIKDINNEAKQLRDQNKKMLSNMQAELFALSYDDTGKLLKQAGKIVAQLAKVTKTFADSYFKEKLKKQVLDFNDLEQLALKILSAESITQDQVKSEASEYYQQQFKEVLVDEYQDINLLQATILGRVSRQDPVGNQFMVGDVKQSIYAFRLADPTLFIEKYQQYEQSENGERIILAENFRSRKEVLDFTNLIFTQLMDPKVGQLAYDEAAKLICGNQNYPESKINQPELIIYENGTESEFEEEEIADLSFSLDDKTSGEVQLVGLKIQELIKNQFPIYDKQQKKTRSIGYQDIVLLTPTKKNNLLLLDILENMGIPVYINDAQNYFQATEIKIMVALLQIIDNPYQDIPLATVLRSPIVGLNENELTELRLADSTASFYHSLLVYVKSYQELQSKINNEKKGKVTNENQSAIEQIIVPDTNIINESNLDIKKERDTTANYGVKIKSKLAQKIIKFLNMLDNWRISARKIKLAELIWQIYTDTHFLEYVGGMPAGKQRQANLHALYDRATSYENMNYRGLFQFVRFIQKMQERDKDLAEPRVMPSGEDAVRIMTIHGSKGLEFPVVFVLDMSRRFNFSDLRNRMILDENIGCGIQYMDLETRVLSATLPFIVAKDQKKRKLLAEEMRKLYVALTRAEEKLFLIGSYKDKATALKKWSSSAMLTTTVLDEYDRLTTQNMLDWVGMALFRHQRFNQYNNEYAITDIPEIAKHPADFLITFVNNNQLIDQIEKRTTNLTNEENSLSTSVIETSEITKAKHLLNYEYSYQAATQTTGYQSVSEIKQLFSDPDESSLLHLDLTETKPKTVHRYTEDELAKPTFLTEAEVISASDIGTATHLVLQQIPLNETITENYLAKFINQLVSQKVLMEKVAKKINQQQLLNFFTSPLGIEITKNADNVQREQPFSMLLKAEQIFKDYPQNATDDILIHGVVDGFIKYSDHLVLYDFKTDHLLDIPSEYQRIKKRYQGQLNLYKEALSNTFNLPVTHSYLVLLSIDKVIELNH